MPGQIIIDGSYGEGGGQILRTAVTLSVITGRAVRIERIRARRPKPGLAAQHLTAVRAAAALCDAELVGDALDSQTLAFTPRRPPRAGNYAFDVVAAREGGSAGAATLVLQTIVLPLTLADGESRVTIQGGTHMAWSPSFDYAADVWLPTLAGLGVRGELTLRAWGWFPVGRGKIDATLHGLRSGASGLHATDLVERGPLQRIVGRAVAANLPAHIPQRMADRARALLADLDVPLRIEPLRVSAACAGAGIFLRAEYAQVRCGFDVLGEIGKPSERVAEEAVHALRRHRASDAALDAHLADQVIVPLALADGLSTFTTEAISNHLRTNAWVIGRFGLADIAIDTDAVGRHQVTVRPVADRESDIG